MADTAANMVFRPTRNAYRRASAVMLSAEAERDVIEGWRNDRDRAAGDRLIRSFVPLVRKYAVRFAKYGVPVEDLVQEGNLALLEAAERFDISRGVRFATYAVWWVRARLQEFVVRNRSIVRLGSTSREKSLFFKLGHLQAAASLRKVDAVSANQQIASATGLQPSQVERLEIQLRKGDLHLDAPLPGGEETVGRLLPDTRPDPETVAAERESRGAATRLLSNALDCLDGRERRIIAARQLSDRRTPLRELAMEYGVSPERVRQIEQYALRKLRCYLVAAVPAKKDLLPSSPALAGAFHSGI